MKKNWFVKNFFITKTIFMVLVVAFVSSSCVGDQSLAKRKGFVKDFSKDAGTASGCGEALLIYTAPFENCTTTCQTGTHISTLEEITKIKQDLVTAGTSLVNNIAADTLLTRVNGSANICVADVIEDLRPTNAISIKNDFCSCINGKADILSDCDVTCSLKPVTAEPFLYVNTTVGPEIALNTKLGNLYNWCTVQLSSDDTTPQCIVTATDGNTTITLPPNLSPGSNSFSVNVNSLAKNRTWIIKINEYKTGTNAQSKEFQIRRKDQPTETSLIGALKVAPINQYSCITYFGNTNTVTGNIDRTSYIEQLYYYAANELPAPMPPPSGNTEPRVVCHNTQIHPARDSIEYERLSLIPGHLAFFDKSDIRFTAKTENAGKLTINKILEERLLNEYQISVTGNGISLFAPLNFFSRASRDGTNLSSLLGYIMIPFTNADTGRAYCPNSTHFNGNQPLFNLLGEYISDTEGLFLAEREGEIVILNGKEEPAYPLMLVKESTVLSYGFYIQNGLKIKADSNSLNSKTIYYYWPLSTTADALTQGNRKIYTIRSYDTLNGAVQTTPPTTERTSDKRIGCIPKI